MIELTDTNSSEIAACVSSYQTCTSTRRFIARPSGVVLLATGRVEPAHSYEIASAGSARRICRNSATSPARSRDRPSLSP